MTTAQAASLLGVTRSRILKMIADGRLRARKLGGEWRIAEKDVEAVRERKAGRPRKS